MNWLEIRAKFDPWPPDISPALELFRGSGIDNTAEEGQWVVGCLADVAGARQRLRGLTSELQRAGAIEITSSEIPDRDWNEHFKQFFRARPIGRSFLIRPSWDKADPPQERIEIVLDPGQAFGTGDHPTTRLCLMLLEELDLSNKTVLDIGCGSGILSIAAAKLGARITIGADVEASAVEIAAANARANRIVASFSCGDGFSSLDLELRADVILTNIISATIIRLAAQVAARLASDGTWILSGVLDANWPEVFEASQRAGFIAQSRLEEDGWVAARLALRSSETADADTITS